VCVCPSLITTTLTSHIRCVVYIISMGCISSKADKSSTADNRAARDDVTEDVKKKAEIASKTEPEPIEATTEATEPVEATVEGTVEGSWMKPLGSIHESQRNNGRTDLRDSHAESVTPLST